MYKELLYMMQVWHVLVCEKRATEDWRKLVSERCLSWWKNWRLSVLPQTFNCLTTELDGKTRQQMAGLMLTSIHAILWESRITNIKWSVVQHSKWDNFAWWYYTLSFTRSLHFQWFPHYWKVTAVSTSFRWNFYVLIWLSWNL